ncbi:S41 family peptidase [Aquimarina sp. AU474]|uniref:S41 family peptidase n=1 Tax=Aquimarina sp. AU474 TaxID=2108529 RepID=UPI000D699C14|nr:S41 family peptidase [Aquimarina sp. AU474]
MLYFRHFLLFVLIGSLSTGCFDDKDDVPQIASTTDINNFIWRGMNVFYLYKADVADLANDRFASDQEYNTFISSFDTPEAIFESLKSNVDEFSFLVDDYIALEQAFDGLTMNNGMEFGLVRYPNVPSNIFGFVRYVLPNTDAQTKGIQRGYIFNTIDGTQITENNFRQLLEPDTYTIGLATFDGTDITPTGESIELTKAQYTENPVFISKTIDVGGSPVGYIMYNAFTADFDAQLNAAFGQFKSDGVTDLILDVRYNGGGSVTSAIDLSSMITGQFNGQVFSTEEWNSELQSQRGEVNLFDTQIRTGEAINNLNLSRVYILTTRSSASASELVINGLDPYIDVIQVGATTRGKFQASITIYDSNNFGRLGANIGHTYAMQPLVLKSINSVGFTDYFNGFVPEIPIEEDFTNPGTIGEANEPLLKAAIDNIIGNKSFHNYNISRLKSVGNSNMFNRDYELMYE